MLLKIIRENKYPIHKKALSLIKYLYFYTVSTLIYRNVYKLVKRSGFQFKPISKEQKKVYKDYWKVFGNLVETKTIRMSYTISEKMDKKIIPENIFFANIELTLNSSKNLYFLRHKSIYNKWYNSDLFPMTYIHCINGQFYDSLLDELQGSEAIESAFKSIAYPVVLKPNVDTQGGQDVFFIHNEQELKDKIDKMKNFVVQEKLMQSKKLLPLNNINTVRVFVYKSVVDEQYYVINTNLKMGVNGSLDNDAAGGIYCNINENGVLNTFAVDNYGKKYFEHPDTQTKFGYEIPFYQQMCENAIKCSRKTLDARIIGLDMFLDENDVWRIIEVNLLGTTLRYAQYSGVPFFGKFTDEVVDYCLKKHWAFQDQHLF